MLQQECYLNFATILYSMYMYILVQYVQCVVLEKTSLGKSTIYQRGGRHAPCSRKVELSAHFLMIGNFKNGRRSQRMTIRVEKRKELKVWTKYANHAFLCCCRINSILWKVARQFRQKAPHRKMLSKISVFHLNHYFNLQVCLSI